MPGAFVIDREMALMKALWNVFPSAIILLYIWHIDTNVVAKCKPHFTVRDVEEWKALAKGCRSVGCVSFLISIMFVHVHSYPNLFLLYKWFTRTRSRSSQKIGKFSNWHSSNATWNMRSILPRRRLIPTRRSVVRAWTNLIKPFGDTITSHGKGAHNIVKEFVASRMEKSVWMLRTYCSVNRKLSDRIHHRTGEAANENLAIHAADPAWWHFIK